MLPEVPALDPVELVSPLCSFLDFLDFFADLTDEVSDLLEVEVWELFVPLVSAGLLVPLVLCELLFVLFVPVVLELPFEL